MSNSLQPHGLYPVKLLCPWNSPGQNTGVGSHSFFNITVIQVYAANSNPEEAEVEWFYEDLQYLLELTPKKDVLFIIGAWNAKVGSQEKPGVTGKLALEYRIKQGKG